jgi:Uma2 family endonuclease
VATTTKLTLAEFLRLPETEPASEYDDGEVCQKTMPTTWHSVVQRLLAYVFTIYLRDHPIGEAGSELRCIFGPTGRERAYVPDYVFIVGVPPGFGSTNGPYEGAPDLAIEILSPDDRPSRVRRKVRFYLANGVQFVWLVDPDRRTLTLITDPAEWLVFGEDEWIDGGEVAPGLSFQVRDILPPATSAPKG